MKLNLLPASTGLTWVKLGFQTFFKQPLALSGLFIMFLVLMSVASLVPYIGTALALALLPAATLGLMAASREVSLGRFPMPTMLFIALRAPRSTQRGLAVLGVSYALGFLSIMGISALVDGGKFAQLYLTGGTVTTELVNAPDFQHAMLLAMALYLPLSMLFWHAPALVHWYGVPPVKSLFFSFVASVRNLGAWLTYSFAWVGVFLVISQTVALVGSLLVSTEFALMLITPVVLILGAVFLASVYFTVRDSFNASENDTPPSHESDTP